MSSSRPAAVSCRTRASGVVKVFQANSSSVEKTTAVMVSCGRSNVARKKRVMAKRVHQRGMGFPPAAESWRNSRAARAATRAAKRVTIQSLPRKMSRPTRTIRTMAVRARFMRFDEDIREVPPSPGILRKLFKAETLGLDFLCKVLEQKELGIKSLESGTWLSQGGLPVRGGSA